ncbi:LA_2272 family surface repeat-containing protein [Sorangium sp. So ce381]|uniref:LA_2272 family surface repeat-containing protein n=1 Tax=Sorangium sp. So ce381 TaxID=3133307 RepID=UPI003F5C0DEE
MSRCARCSLRTAPIVAACALAPAVLAPRSALAQQPADAAPGRAAPRSAGPSDPSGAGGAGGERARRGPDTPYFPVNLSLIFPLSTNATAPDLATHLDLALLLGRVGFVDGAQVGLFSWTSGDLRGLQLGVASVVSGRAEGLQLAGGFALADAPLAGVQLAGLFGWASTTVAGAQIAGVANQTYADVDGLQAAGAVNVARGQVTGVQAAAVNIGRVDGLQIGAINVSQEQRGLQIGIINVARKIDGLQIGVINVTDNLEGESLGLIPLPREGGIRLALWGSTGLHGNVGLKFSSRYAYTILSFGLHSEPRAPNADEGRAAQREPLYAVGLAMGSRLPLDVEDLSLSADVGAYHRGPFQGDLPGRNEVLKARVSASYALAERLSPFVCAGGYMTLRGQGALDVGGGPELCLGVELGLLDAARRVRAPAAPAAPAALAGRGGALRASPGPARTTGASSSHRGS